MAFNGGPHNIIDQPLYNSRITRIYLGYLGENYPKIDIDSVLNSAGMTKYSVEDPAHWFTQDQVDRFHEILVKKTRNQNISREAGQYAVLYGGFGGMKQYLLGLMNVGTIYILTGKIYTMFSRGATIKSQRLGPNKVEIVSTPNEGVKEKPYQCENRIGTFESLATLFTKKYAKVEHPFCLHKGDNYCRYIITWDKTPSLSWKLIRNYYILFSILGSVSLFFFIPVIPWVAVTILFASIAMIFSLYTGEIERAELTEIIKTQGNASNDLINEMNIRYNNALLAQEIGQATATILDIEKLISAVMGVIGKRLDFDRGMFLLANKDKTRLVCKAGYGYGEDIQEILQATEFHVDNPESRGLFVLAFREQKPFLINDITEIEKQFSKRSQELARQMSVHSIICVPVIYKKESLGILAVDNIKSKRLLTQSDINLLMGIASQTAVSVTNATSYEKLQESEKKYRELVENANSIIMRVDINWNITFFNEFAQKFFGYSENEILKMNVKGTILHDSESTRHSLEKLGMLLYRDSERKVVTENENFLRNGKPVWIAWTYKPIFNDKGDLKEILCIGNDVTDLKHAGSEKKALKNQLISAQKMEAIGTLAGGIAHDFNNILQAIISCAQILMMKKTQDHPDYNLLDTIITSVMAGSDLTKRLLIFSRKVKSDLRPINLNQEIVQVSKMLERTIPKMISIELHLAANLKTINADSGQIEQIIMNLGVNARDAMPDGGTLIFKSENITLDREYFKSHIGSSPGEYVLLSVSDTGHGMDKEVMERIFEPFFTTKKTGKGTGLGMAMVYGIVESHNGYITCDSKIGQGSSFNIYFPVIEEEVEVVDLEKEEVPIRRGNETILLVDDDENIRQSASEIMINFGYKVLTAVDGETSLEIYQNEFEKISLVILDLIMPGMGGRRCLEKLIEINPHVQVIIASGYSEDVEAREWLEKHAQGFIDKPYEFRQLLNMIREVLNGN